MPRDVSGNYTLPAGINPVVTNTLIDIDWANPTLDDIAAQLNNVLTRDGLLGPTTVFKVQDGTVAAPSLSFASQTGTGLYRPAAINALAVTVLGTERGRFTTTGLDVTGTVTADVLTTTGNTTLGNASTDTLNVGNGGIVKNASGNVGIGVTPSTWSGAGGPAVEVGAVGSAIVGNSSVLDLIRNAYYNGEWKYASTAAAAYYEVGNGTHKWFTAASGSANAAITFAERMRIGATGTVTMFAPAADQSIQIYSSNESGSVSTPIINTFNTNAGDVQQFVLTFQGQSVIMGNRRTSGDLLFQTNDVSRMAIRSGGGVVIANLAGSGNRQVMVDANGQLYAA